MFCCVRFQQDNVLRVYRAEASIFRNNFLFLLPPPPAPAQ